MLRPLQGDTTQYQHKRIRPQQLELRRGTPVLIRHPACIGDHQKREQDRDHRKKHPQGGFPRSPRGYVSIAKIFDDALSGHPRLDHQLMEHTHVVGFLAAYVLLLRVTSRGGTFCGMKSWSAPGTL